MYFLKLSKVTTPLLPSPKIDVFKENLEARDVECALSTSLSKNCKENKCSFPWFGWRPSKQAACRAMHALFLKCSKS